MHPRIMQHQTRLDNLFQQGSQIQNMAQQGEWARYLCVLSSGYVENAIRILLEDFISRNSSTKIQRYTEPIISNLTNCKHGKIVKVLEQFDVNWARTFTSEIDAKSHIPNEIKDAIDSLVQNRHDVAHGKNTGIGLARVTTYYSKAKIVVNVLESIIN